MMTTFSTAYSYLNNTRPNSAKKEVLKIIPDGFLVTQKMKDDIINIIERFGF